MLGNNTNDQRSGYVSNNSYHRPTGRVGAELVRLLTRKGEAVRAATRNPSAASVRLPHVSEIVEFDFDRPETFAPALKGMERIFLIARPGDNHSDRVQPRTKCGEWQEWRNLRKKIKHQAG